MILFSNAKINLGLQITGKRKDGYHNIETILIPVPLYDIIEIHQSARFKLYLYGRPVPGPTDENLVTKAYHLLKTKFSFPEIEVLLLKNIPAGTGLGGGPSNAAHLMKGLNQLFNLGIAMGTLVQMAGSLGSDCPFFIQNKPVLITGRGEIFQNINVNLQGYFLVLVFSGIHIATQKAYATLQSIVYHKDSLRELIDQPVENWGHYLNNDFEGALFKQYPLLKEIKSDLTERGAFFTSLTGSGSVVYGLFKDKPLLLNVSSSLQYWSCRL